MEDLRYAAHAPGPNLGSCMGLTLVSALYDLARREQNPRRRTVEDYLQASAFLASRDVDLVVFGDPEPVAEIESQRRASGLAGRTHAVRLPLEELPAYALLDPITRAREEHPVANASPDKDTPLYIALTWSKFDLLQRAAELDPFACSHLAWIDIGLGGRPHPGEDVFGKTARGVRLLMMRPFAEADVTADEDYFSALRGHIAAGYVSGERDRVRHAARLFSSLACGVLDDGFAPSEEQLLPVLCSREPDLFEFHHGDYGHILENYVRPRSSSANLAFQLRVARDLKLHQLALDLCSAVVESHRDGAFAADPAELAALLDECFLAAWYAGDDGNRSLAHEVKRLYIEEIRSDPAFREVYQRDEARVRINFSLL